MVAGSSWRWSDCSSTLRPGTVNKVLPPAVTGAVVMLIGFNLAPVAANTYLPPTTGSR